VPCMNPVETTMQAFNPIAAQVAEGMTGAAFKTATNVPSQADAAELGAFVAALLAQSMTPPNGVDAGAATAAVQTAAASGPLPLERQALAGLDSATAITPAVVGTEVDLGAMPALARAAGRDGMADVMDVPAEELEAVVREAHAPRDPARAARGPQSTALPGLALAKSGTELAPMLAALSAEQTAGGVDAAAEFAVPATEEGTAVNTVHKFVDNLQLAQTFNGKAAPLPVHEPGLFAERLNQQVAVMLGHNAQHARLAVNPPELGPVEVRVSVVGDEATIQLVATQAATREALEEALPRLRAAFADSGIALGDAGVYSEMPERQAQARDESGGDAPALSAFGENVVAEEPQPLRMVRLGLVDAFV